MSKINQNNKEDNIASCIYAYFLNMNMYMNKRFMHSIITF